MKKGEIILKLLEILENSVLDISDHFLVYLKAGHGASYHKLEHGLYKTRKERKTEKLFNEEEKRIILRQRYQKLIYKLKN